MKLQQKPPFSPEKQNPVIQQVELRTNMYQLTLQNDQQQIDPLEDKPLSIYQYSIRVQPTISDDNKVLLIKLFKGAKQNLECLLGRYYISGRFVYTLNKVELTQMIEVQVLGFTFNIQIIFRRKIDIFSSNLQNIYQKDISAITIQCLRAIYQDISSQFCSKPLNKNKLKNNSLAISNRPKKKIFSVASFQSFFGTQLYLVVDQIPNLDIKLNVYAILKQFSNQNDQEKAIIGNFVSTKYKRNQFLVHRINFQMNPQSLFQCVKMGKRISFQDYYKEMYNITIKDQQQPLLIHQIKIKDQITQQIRFENIYLVPELCFICRQQQKSLLNNPLESKQQLSQQQQQYSDQLYYQQIQAFNIIQKLSSETGIKVDQHDNIINGIQLLAPKLTLQNDKEIKMGQGSKKFTIDTQITNSITFKEWIFLYPRTERKISDKLTLFIKAIAQKLGIQVNDPIIYEMHNEDLQDGIPLLKRDFKKHPLPQFILSFVPQNHPCQQTFYKEIKEFLCGEVGLEHQHITKAFCNQIEKINIAQSIVLQIVSKLGNPLWKTSLPSQISKQTMVIGIAIGSKVFINQNQKGKNVNETMVAVVTTLNEEMSRMNSEIYYKDEQDLTLHQILSKIIKASLVEYALNRLQLPDDIIIYRQGLSSSQIPISMIHEVEAIKNGFRQYNQKYSPKFAYIQVCKSVNQRFYSEMVSQVGDQNTLKSANSGSIVPLIDNCIGQFEFFLCSQDISRGVSVPTKYICLFNSTKLSKETIWQFTYNQCFNYYNSSGPIRIPAQLMYATKLLSFRQKILHQNPSHALKQSLYYI